MKSVFNFAPGGEIEAGYPEGSQRYKALQSGHSATVQILQSPNDDRRVEVCLEPHDGTDETRVVLRYSTWTEGLGWCSQKTIQVDSDQLDDLHRALTVARHRLNRQRAGRGRQAEPAQVIQLPTLA